MTDKFLNKTDDKKVKVIKKEITEILEITGIPKIKDSKLWEEQGVRALDVFGKNCIYEVYNTNTENSVPMRGHLVDELIGILDTESKLRNDLKLGRITEFNKKPYDVKFLRYEV